MAPITRYPVTVARRPARPPPRRPRWSSVVWLRGDHDLSTVADLSESFATVIAIDEADVVADLSEVTFMGAETVGVLVRVRQGLFLRSRTLELRRPSHAAERLLDLCDVTLIDDRRPFGDAVAAGEACALGTWVAVPPAARRDRPGATSRTRRLARPPPRQRRRVAIPKRDALVPRRVAANVDGPVRRGGR